MLQSVRSKSARRGRLLWTQVQRLPDQYYGQINAYIGWLVPPLERVERREGAERQGGEFVEADDCK